MIWLYLIDVLTTVDNVLMFLILAMLIGWTFCAVMYLDTTGEFRPFKVVIAIIVLLGVIAILIPSQKTMYAMGALYIGKEISEIDSVSRIGSKSVHLLESWLDKTTQELQRSKKK